MATVSSLRLSDFDISESTGFLHFNPLRELPDKFGPWHVLAKSMPDLVKKHAFREKVNQMPLLDSSVLLEERQQRLAHLQLSVIASGYVWQEGKDNVTKVLPACVAVPLWNVSKSLGIQPVISHPGLFLANWQLKDIVKPMSVSNLRCLYSLPGGDDGDGMVIITNVVEMQFAPALQCIVKGAYCVDTADVDGLTSALSGIRDALVTMKATFTGVHSYTRASVLYKEFIPFLGGWGYEGSPLPDGLIYEGVSDVPVKCVSASAAQTSTVPSLDAFLDIQHEPESLAFLLSRRAYMPRGHRRFIEVLEARQSTREFVMKSCSEELKKTYNQCVAALTEFRNYHIQVVTKYVVVMTKKEKDIELKVKGVDKETDEAKLMSLLKDLRTETKGNVVSG